MQNKHILSGVLIAVFIIAFSALNAAAQTSLAVGEKANNFTLPNAYGEEVDLYTELEKGAAIVSFYRGSWCPICNVQLRSYQQKLPEIQALGAQLIAISPETPSSTEAALVKSKLTFQTLSDKGNITANDYGILWSVPEGAKEGFSKWLKQSSGKELEDFNDSEGYALPMPATFVINKNGIVTYAFVEEDYKQRAKIEDIINTLQDMKNEKELPSN